MLNDFELDITVTYFELEIYSFHKHTSYRYNCNTNEVCLGKCLATDRVTAECDTYVADNLHLLLK